MAKSINQAFSNTKNKNKNDELYTPPILVDAVYDLFCERLESIRRHYHRTPTVLCPFDTKDSEFVIKFGKNYNVKYGHISTGQDFFEYDYGQWDVCISNPPFSRKLDVFKRLNSFRNPWAMICNVMALNYHEIINYFSDNPVELIFFDKRVSFNGNASSFGSCYICNDMIMNDVKFIKLEHNNVGKYFVPSRMLTFPPSN
jgi:hypothetical protein